MSAHFLFSRLLLHALSTLLISVAFAQEQPGAIQPADAGLREVQLTADSFSRGAPLPPWVQRQPIPPTTRTNPLVLRLSDTQIRLGESPSVFFDVALQANNATALPSIGQLTFNFVPQYQQFHLHSVKLLRGDATLERTDTASLRFLQRETGLEQGIYSGEVTVVLVIPDVRVGDTLSVAYRVDGGNPVFGNTFSGLYLWDAWAPVEWRRVVLTHPEGRKINWRMVGDYRRSAVSPAVSRSAGKQTLLFEERGIEPLPTPEPFVPDDYVQNRMLQFSEYRDWNQVARLFEGLFTPGRPLPDELKTLLRRFGELPDTTARVAAALSWVQGEIRNFSVSIGESSHRPHALEVILQQRYGDCKDKTYLLLTLLHQLGVDAQPVLVSMARPRGPGKLLATPDAFDHVLVQVQLDGATLYLDPTRAPQPVPLARLVQPPPRVLGLVASANAIAPAPVSPSVERGFPDLELEEYMRLPQLAAEGTLDSRLTYAGETGAEVIRSLWPQLTPEERRALALRPYERRYAGIELAADPETADDVENNRFTVVNHFKVPTLAQADNGNWRVSFFPHILKDAFNVPPSLHRQFPLRAMSQHPLELRYKLGVEWPSHVSVLRDPMTSEIQGGLFRAEVRSAFRGSRFDFSLEFKTVASDLAAAEAPQFQEELSRLERLVGGQVVITKAEIKDDAVPEAGANPTQASMKRQKQEVVDRATRTIADGRLSGDDLVEALCMRAFALGDIEQFEEGMKDAAEAVRVAPASARAWQCRGEMLVQHGEFLEADAALTRALVLGYSARPALRHRGLARFFLGRYDDAATDFAKAAAAGKDDEQELYVRMWQIWSLQRAGESLPDDVLTLSRSDPQGAWPRPALSMLVGDMTPDALLALVEKLHGDERVLNLTEALFYVGEHHLAHGRTGEARDAFERCRALGITFYSEYVAAGFELNRLNRRE